MYPRRFSHHSGALLLRCTVTGRKIVEFVRGKIHRKTTTCNDSKVDHLKMWEELLAQRLRRLRRFYASTGWLNKALVRSILANFKGKSRSKGSLTLGAAGVSAYDWSKQRIPMSDIEAHRDDFNYVEILKENTICLACDTTKRPKEDDKNLICKCGRIFKESAAYEGWELFLEKDDLVVWRKPHQSGQFEYKVFGSYPDVCAEDFLNVQIDTDYRRKWDTTAVVLEIGETDPDPDTNGDILYWEMLWPRLFVNRDYVFKRRYHVDETTKTLFIMSKTTDYPKYPKFPEKFRIEDYWSCMVIRPYTDTDKPGLEFCLTYFDNPGVSIPSTVQTWVAKKAMPDFLDKLRQATKDYRNYCVKEGTTESCKKIREEEAKKISEKLDYCSFERLRPKEQENYEESEKYGNGVWKYFYPLYYFS